MPRHKADQREQITSQTRQLLLQAATAEFAREGYVGANINRISRAAGFAKGTIYNYFSSKRALMLALIQQVASDHLTFVTAHVLAESDPVRRLERFFQAGFAFVNQHGAQARVMLNTLYGPDQEFKARMYEAYQPMFQLVGEHIVAAGMAQGVFRAVDPQATAALLMTVYLGTASQVSSEGRTWLDPDQVADFTRHALRERESE